GRQRVARKVLPLRRRLGLHLAQAIVDGRLKSRVVLKGIIEIALRLAAVDAGGVVIKIERILAALNEGLLEAHCLIEALLLQVSGLFGGAGCGLRAEIVAERGSCSA